MTINSTDFDTGFKTFRFSIKKLADFLGFKYKNRYADIRKIIKQLADAKIIIPNSLTKSIIIINWLARLEISQSNDFVDLKLNAELEEYLIDSKPNYLTYQLAIIMPMKSAHSVKLYHIFLKNFWKKDGEIIKNSFTMTVDELKEVLSISKEAYPSAGNFKIKVLDIAQKECEAYSDIVFTFEPLKHKKQIHSYKFNIFSNPNYKPVSFDLEPLSSHFTGPEKNNAAIKNAIQKGYEGVINKLNNYKVAKSGILEIVKLCSPEEISEVIKIVENNSKIENIPGFIRAECRKINKERTSLKEIQLIFDETKKEDELQKVIEETQMQIAATKEKEEREKKDFEIQEYLKRIGEKDFEILTEEFLNNASDFLKRNFDPVEARISKSKSHRNLVHYLNTKSEL